MLQCQLSSPPPPPAHRIPLRKPLSLGTVWQVPLVILAWNQDQGSLWISCKSPPDPVPHPPFGVCR